MCSASIKAARPQTPLARQRSSVTAAGGRGTRGWRSPSEPRSRERAPLPRCKTTSSPAGRRASSPRRCAWSRATCRSSARVSPRVPEHLIARGPPLGRPRVVLAPAAAPPPRTARDDTNDARRAVAPREPFDPHRRRPRSSTRRDRPTLTRLPATQPTTAGSRSSAPTRRRPPPSATASRPSSPNSRRSTSAR